MLKALLLLLLLFVLTFALCNFLFSPTKHKP